MAIYIKGVTMPKHRAIDLTITPDGSAIIWGTTHRLLDEKCTYIPEPHGRLIDGDAICDEMNDYSNTVFKTGYLVSAKNKFYKLNELLEDAPTVIEGSE